MSKRMTNIILGAATLIVGCLLYILYREETYVGKLFDGMPLVEQARLMADGYGCDLFRYYLPDFMWGFSLSCCIQAIYVPGFKGGCLCCGTAFLCGCGWEILQFLQIADGTADFVDILMYFLAAVLSVIINLGGKKYEKKENMLASDSAADRIVCDLRDGQR